MQKSGMELVERGEGGELGDRETVAVAAKSGGQNRSIFSRMSSGGRVE